MTRWMGYVKVCARKRFLPHFPLQPICLPFRHEYDISPSSIFSLPLLQTCVVLPAGSEARLSYLPASCAVGPGPTDLLNHSHLGDEKE